MKSKRKRPKFLNLFKIHLPVTGVNSFAHRVSGALMFVAIPGLIYLFGLSLRDSQGYSQALSLLNKVPVKLCSSIFDASIGAELPAAKASAWAVNIAGVLIFLYFAYKIWL